VLNVYLASHQNRGSNSAKVVQIRNQIRTLESENAVLKIENSKLSENLNQLKIKNLDLEDKTLQGNQIRL
jgi:regulator of replication initiation timing